MENFPPDTNPAGVITALCITVRALIEHHPDGSVLRQALHEAHEQTIANLLGLPTKDVSVESYEHTLGLLGIDRGVSRH